MLIWGTYYHKFGQNIKIFKILCTKHMASSEVMTSSTHSFAYSYRLVKKCFVKICKTSKCHNFLIFQPIFIRFSLLCLKICTLSSEIKLNLLWSSPLSSILHNSIWSICKRILLFRNQIQSFKLFTTNWITFSRTGVRSACYIKSLADR